MSGWTVPGYTEMKTLGVGGFGAVVLARHDATGTPVAIKFLRQDLLADPGFNDLFRAEAVLLSAVDSPYVVRLYEYVEAPAGAAIVMELIDGVSLHEMVTRQGKTTPEAALVALYGSLLGLAAAHARGVVHRDFKPANVLVNAYGASKLTDFGISTRTGSTTVPAGSLSYAPPEQFDGGPATPASDVYAATATFYECLTGHPPFRGDTMDELIGQHRSAEVPMDPVPEPLRPIVARGMAKDPGDRPADASALAADLRAAATGAYGPDWERHGRSHLAEAALLLAALWPSAGASGAQGWTQFQVTLHQAQARQAVRQPQPTQAARHRWHMRHVRHLEHLQHERSLQRAVRQSGHLLRNTMAVLTTAAVATAVGTVVATRNSASTASSADSSPHQSAVAVFSVVPQSTSQQPSSQSPSPQSPSPQQPTPQQSSPQQPSPQSPTPQGPAPGDYPVNRQIPNSLSWLVTLTDIRVLPSGQAEFFVVYDNNGSGIENLSCLGNTDPSVNTVTLSNGQAVAATADYCSQHPDDANIDINQGQTFTSYVIFPDAAQLTKPFEFSWDAEGLAGALEDLQLPA